MRHPLTDQYTAGRERLIELARTVTDEEAATLSSACPAWTVQDLYAHLAGISSDILAGNTEGAATVEWADRQVSERRGRSLSAVVEEWSAAGAEVSAVMGAAGDAFPVELFLDQWTHEWDIRAALGERAAAVPDTTVIEHYLDQVAEIMQGDAITAGLDRLDIDVDGRVFALGSGESAGTLPMSVFEFGRLCMGRRSAIQIDAMDWPARAMTAHLDVIVRWSVNGQDVVDPVLSGS